MDREIYGEKYRERERDVDNIIERESGREIYG